jgi:H/ACA ribonucleoprotein complex subunit 4
MLIKSKDVINSRHGCTPEQRDMNALLERGVINLDKPPGPTSHEVASYVKEILGVHKAGHGGTLDPDVTGVLPIFLGRAAKLSGIVSKKEYICLMRLFSRKKSEDVRDVCEEFVGRIYQRPPLKSAVKRIIRIREIYYIDVMEVDGKEVLMKVGCESGTYIRKLVYDIGEVLGCGAEMYQLRRTKSGPFLEEDSIILHDLKDAYVFWREDGDETFIRRAILPMEKGLIDLPKISIRDSAVDAICHGADLMVPGVLMVDDGIKSGETVAIFTLKGECVCIGEAKMRSEEMIEAENGVAVDTKNVLMDPGEYPKGWR